MEKDKPAGFLKGSVADISAQTTIVFNPDLAARVPHARFRYGWCATDHKTGREIRQDYRKVDYLYDEPYKSSVRRSLKKLGLPLPGKSEIFRGTRHDLLFLDSHGVVLRIGPIDINDLLNPAILQPLGWIEDRENMICRNPFTVAIYPGIEIHRNFENDPSRPQELTDLYSFLSGTSQGTGDSYGNNTGYIRVLDEVKQREVGVHMLLDMDNVYNGTGMNARKQRADILAAVRKEAGGYDDVLSKTICAAFKDVADAEFYKKAFEVHNPLRKLFWASFDGREEGGAPDPAAIKYFWDTCARVTNNPASCVMPVWKSAGREGTPRFTRKEVFMPQVILYRPWTGDPMDAFVPPIGLEPCAVKALREEHREKIEQKKRDRIKACWFEHLDREMRLGEGNWQLFADRQKWAREEAERLKRLGERHWSEHLQHEMHLGEDNWDILAQQIKAQEAEREKPPAPDAKPSKGPGSGGKPQG